MPQLTQEPKGQRRDLLHQQIVYWMKEAESIKSLLTAHIIDDDESVEGSNLDSLNHREHCTVQ